MYPENLILSANAPRISAGVMMANIHWNMTNVSSGISPVVNVLMVIPWRNALSNPPIMAPNGLPDSIKLVPNAQLYPKATHNILTTPTMSNVCMMILNIFFWRTNPP